MEITDTDIPRLVHYTVDLSDRYPAFVFLDFARYSDNGRHDNCPCKKDLYSGEPQNGKLNQPPLWCKLITPPRLLTTSFNEKGSTYQEE